MLLRENLKDAGLLLWKNYIMIGCGRHIYLGDRFSTKGNIDWYFLNGIGSHSGERRVFRYSKACENGYNTHKATNEKARGEVISLKTEDGRIIYYSQEQDKKYLVYPTEEREGGILLPAEKFISDKELLIFSAGSGIYIFNSDMRGVAPREIRDKADFDKEEYKRLYGHLIHKSFYSFDHHTPKYIIATCYDDCGFPYEKKSAIGQSLMLRLSVSEKTNIRVKINTESEKDILQNIKASIEERTVDVYQNSAIPLPVAEKAHRFNSKQIIIEAEDYCSPIAFHSLAFRYLIEEKIKKG